MSSIFLNGKMSVENQALKSEKTRVYTQKPLLNIPFKNSISGNEKAFPYSFAPVVGASAFHPLEHVDLQPVHLCVRKQSLFCPREQLKTGLTTWIN
jgi:hypothetical protein